MLHDTKNCAHNNKLLFNNKLFEKEHEIKAQNYGLTHGLIYTMSV